MAGARGEGSERRRHAAAPESADASPQLCQSIDQEGRLESLDLGVPRIPVEMSIRHNNKICGSAQRFRAQHNGLAHVMN